MCRTIPVRAVVAILIFFGSFISYTLRAHMSIIVLKISIPLNYSISNDPDCYNSPVFYHQKRSSFNNSLFYHPTLPFIKDDHLKPLNPLWVATLFSTYSWGYSFSILVSQAVANKLGTVRTIGYSTLISAGLTLLSPLAYDYGVFVFLAARFVVGVTSGFVFPLLHILIIQWSPMKERNAFGATLYGTSFGIIGAYTIGAYILLHMPWPWIAYTCGVFSSIWAIIWLAFVTDTPADHEWVTAQEREVIAFRRISAHTRRNPKSIPWKKIMKSTPVRALFFLLLGNTWNLTFYLDYMPIVFHQVLKYDLVTASTLAGLPIITRMVFSWFCVLVAEFLLSGRCLTVGNTRKFFTVFSNILPGALQLIMVYMICDQTITTIDLILVLGLNGAAVGGGLANIADLTPHFAGPIYNALQALLSIGGICMPYMVGVVLIYSNNRIKGWAIVLIVNALMYLLGGIVFLIYGSGSVQSWDVTTLRGSVMLGMMGDESDEDIEMLSRRNTDY